MENLIEFMNDLLVSSLKSITNNELCETSCLPNRQNIYHKAANSTCDYFEQLSHSKSIRNNKLSIALTRVRTKEIQNGFCYQGAIIYNLLTRDIRMQENENLFLKRLRNFNF